jgi:hypothetical protein
VEKSIHTILIERQQQLDAVLHDISGLSNVIDGMSHLRQRLLETEDNITQSMILHRGYMSSLWHLPVEILSQIFIHCLHSWETGLCTDNVSPMLAPLLLTRVCRRWRDVAVNMPILWCTLSVTYPSRISWEEASFWYNVWLKRSQEHPLSLLIYFSDNEFTQIQSLLQPYNTLVSSLDLRLTARAFFYEPSLLFQDSRLPALQELSISWKEYPYWDVVSTWISRLPSTLRTLNVVIYQYRDFLRLFHLCPNLSSLIVRMSWWGETAGMEPLESFIHANLQSLYISSASCSRKNFLPDVFNALTLPHLRDLTVDYVKLPHDELKAFLTRSNCPLEHLRCIDCKPEITDQQRAEYIALVPSLEVLVSVTDSLSELSSDSELST